MKINLDKSQVFALFMTSVFSLLIFSVFVDYYLKVLCFTYYYTLLCIAFFVVKWAKLDIMTAFVLFFISFLMLLGLAMIFINYNILAFVSIYMLSGVVIFITFQDKIDKKLKHLRNS